MDASSVFLSCLLDFILEIFWLCTWCRNWCNRFLNIKIAVFKGFTFLLLQQIQFWRVFNWFQSKKLSQKAIYFFRKPGEEAEQVTPPPDSGINPRTRVHEYGGGETTYGDGVLYFTNFAWVSIQNLSSLQVFQCCRCSVLIWTYMGQVTTFKSKNAC